jgi:hypothetical protein
MESERLVLYSQEPITGSHLEQAESSSQLHKLFCEYFNIIFLSTPWSNKLSLPFRVSD